MDKIYLAISYDRHTDDTYIAFKKLSDAIRQCEEWLKDYPTYVFAEPSWDWEESFKYYKQSEFEDGPRVYVQEIDLN